MAHQINTEVRQCIDTCLECHSICTETVDHCLGLGGKYAEVQHIRLLLDCAEICQTSADFMLRSSNFHERTCAVCAEICQRCAEACELMAGGDSIMRRCAEICRKCAESCKKMNVLTTV